MNPIFNFCPLLFWMFVFYSVNLWKPPAEKQAQAVFSMWILGTVIFLGIGIWLTLLQ